MNASPIARFIDTFAQTSNCDNVEAQVAQFAETFLAAGPQGAKCVSAADFAVALPKRRKLFDSLGCRSTRLVSMDELPLDSRYVLVKTTWEMIFGSPEGDPKEVLADSTFIVDTGCENFRIVLYLANQDIVQVLKERGIAPV